jgi:hypothetical protein
MYQLKMESNKGIKPICIIFCTFLISCQPHSKVEQINYCPNEIELLKSSYPLNANFDFSLSAKEQIKHIQKQIDTPICLGVIPINGTFTFDTIQLQTLLLIDWFCDDTKYFPSDQLLPCYLVRSKQILINANNQILIDGNVYPIDSITKIVAKISREFFWNNSYKRLAYSIKWAKETDYTQIIEVFKSVINGYLQAANEISIEEFKSPLCELNTENLNLLKSKFHFSFLIQKKPPPPLAPASVPLVVKTSQHI